MAALAMFRSLTQIEQNLILEEVAKLDFRYPDHVTFDINTFFEARLQSRATNITWPKDLSKKEIAVCKINYLMAMITEAANIQDISTEYIDLFDILHKFLTEVIRDCYKPATQTPEGKYIKFGGIPADIAPLVNAIYKSMTRNYQKKFDI